MKRDWDERYSNQENPESEPEPLLVRFVDGLAPGRALDVACGAGRHALFLARLGWQVEAVDSSRVAIEILKKRATAAGVELETVVADLEKGKFQIAVERYDLICDFFYLQRDLFASIRAGVRRGGLFAASIHMFDDTPGLRPMNPAYLLREGELRAEFADWEFLHYSEKQPDASHRRRTALVVARRP